ncbi:MAG TPA: VanZ family protein, partial [Ignavibacteriaceae bacterium]
MSSMERGIFDLEFVGIMNHESLKYKRLIFWLFVSAIILQSVAPVNSVNSKINNSYVFFIRMDYLLHVMMFVGLSVLYKLAYFQKCNFSWVKEFSYFVILLFMAILLETLQLVVPRRTFNIND